MDRPSENSCPPDESTVYQCPIIWVGISIELKVYYVSIISFPYLC